MQNLVRAHIFVYGKVHGVFFRMNIQRKAEKLGLKGFVRNINTNNKSAVELLLEGDESSVNNIIVYCKEGPILAKIDGVEVRWETYKGEFPDFRVLYQ